MSGACIPATHNFVRFVVLGGWYSFACPVDQQHLVKELLSSPLSEVIKCGFAPVLRSHIEKRPLLSCPGPIGSALFAPVIGITGLASVMGRILFLWQ